MAPVHDTVLITGASSGIGRALAHLFAADGYALVLVARRATALEELANEIAQRDGVPARALPADLTESDAPARIASELRQLGVTVDVLVNNAGFALQGSFASLPLDRQLSMVMLNVTALTALTHHLLPDMIRRGRGGVLNVGSTAGFQPGPFMAVYYATKAYVNSFSQALGEELQGSGLKVSCLAPGPTATGFASEAGATESPLFAGVTATADEVARAAYAGWKNSTPVVVPGWGNRLRRMLSRFAPSSMVLKAVRRLNGG
jgi:short-subunit dehydrogenase